MEPRQEQRTAVRQLGKEASTAQRREREKPSRFHIEKLEERIAPHCTPLRPHGWHCNKL